MQCVCVALRLNASGVNSTLRRRTNPIWFPFFEPKNPVASTVIGSRAKTVLCFCVAKIQRLQQTVAIVTGGSSSTPAALGAFKGHGPRHVQAKVHSGA